ncbi:MAG TPA: hypothetical protein VFN78_02510 [Ktedonobacterales bacterium]|nr:hypothetical protein [Ktedonobacterales bacterium]
MDLVNITGFNLLPEVAAQLPEIASRVVRKAAFDIQHEAMVNHPFNNDTGFAENSIYVVTHDSSDYGQNLMNMSGAQKPGAELLPEIERPSSRTTAFVAWGANYGIYLEMGTINAPAFPTLAPAAEIVRPQFQAAMETLEDQLVL